LSESMVGKKNENMARIVGGRVADENEYPFIVTIYREHKKTGKMGHWCGGSIISENVIISAGHCVMDTSYYNHKYKITVGEHKRSESSGNEIEFEVLYIFLHPEFDSRYRVKQDLSLIKIKGQFPCNNKLVNPVCMPEIQGDSDTFFDGKSAMLAGWGGISTSGYEMADVLKETPVMLLEVKKCEKETDYPDGFFTGPRKYGPKICGVTPHAAVCYGDSGGPLVVDIKKGKGHKYVLVGTVSGGLPDKECDAPGHYMRVGSYAQWIKWYTEETNNVHWVQLKKDDISTESDVGSFLAVSTDNTSNMLTLGFLGIISGIVGFAAAKYNVSNKIRDAYEQL